MSELLTGLSVGLAIGMLIAAVWCDFLIRKYTIRENQKKTEFGNTRYQEGFTQGEATGIQTGHIDGWQDGWEAREAEVEYLKRQELKSGE